ncbi:hypothetical protein [Nitratifractor sp.]
MIRKLKKRVKPIRCSRKCLKCVDARCVGVSERSAGAPARGEAFSKGKLLCLCSSARRRVYAEGIADARWHSLRSPIPSMINADEVLADA